jgi:putative peptidoglycan lipid II flippase
VSDPSDPPLAVLAPGAEVEPPAPTVRTASLLRSTATISGWNIVSRITGFVRVLAVGAALGTTFLGNTYQSANLVSNILFELLAAGLLAAPLVPAFVALLDRGRRHDAEALAGSLLTMTLVGLGTVAVLGMLAAPTVMRVLTADVADASVRAGEIRLGTIWLWFFLPQMLLYAVGAVSSAFLNAERRFAAVSFAPVANNLIVIATMIAFVVLHDGHGGGGLALTAAQKLVIGVGTTTGVLAMAAVPVIALWRGDGAVLRPRRVERSSPALREVVRVGLWSVAFLATDEVLLAVSLVLANRVEGGVVAYQIAFTFFLLPYAVLAHPIVTALYPRLSSDAHAGRWAGFTRDLAGGVRLTVFAVLPAAALLAVLAQPMMQVVRLGALDGEGAALVARVLGAYCAGLAGYAVLLFVVRAATAAGQVRAAAAVGAGVLVTGTVLMVVLASAANGANRVVALGVAHSIAMSGGAVVLYRVVRTRAVALAGVAVEATVLPTIARSLATALLGGGLAWTAVVVAGRPGGRLSAVAAVVAGAVVGAAGVLAGQWLLRSPELAAVRTPDFGLEPSAVTGPA